MGNCCCCKAKNYERINNNRGAHLNSAYKTTAYGSSKSSFISVLDYADIDIDSNKKSFAPSSKSNRGAGTLARDTTDTSSKKIIIETDNGLHVRKDLDIDLLLIGKTGTGKSALGNTILGKRAFESQANTSSITETVQYEFGEFENRVIKVVDTPGVGDTNRDKTEATEHLLEAMKHAIVNNPEGYHAFLIVLKFGERFASQDTDTIKTLKAIFGESFLKDFGILVMTNGDGFEIESKENRQTFEEWCSVQHGVFPELLKECDNRIVLFDNKTNEDGKKNNQIATLISLIDNLKASGQRYRNTIFDEAYASREKLQIEANIPIINEEYMKEYSLILSKLRSIDIYGNADENIAKLKELSERTNKLQNYISKEDNGSGLLHDKFKFIEYLQFSINEKINYSNFQKGIELNKLGLEAKIKMCEKDFNIKIQALEENHIKQRKIENNRLAQEKMRLKKMEKDILKKIIKEEEDRLIKNRQEEKEIIRKRDEEDKRRKIKEDTNRKEQWEHLIKERRQEDDDRKERLAVEAKEIRRAREEEREEIKKEGGKIIKKIEEEIKLMEENFKNLTSKLNSEAKRLIEEEKNRISLEEHNLESCRERQRMEEENAQRSYERIKSENDKFKLRIVEVIKAIFKKIFSYIMNSVVSDDLHTFSF